MPLPVVHLSTSATDKREGELHLRSIRRHVLDRNQKTAARCQPTKVNTIAFASRLEQHPVPVPNHKVQYSIINTLIGAFVIYGETEGVTRPNALYELSRFADERGALKNDLAA